MLLFMPLVIFAAERHGEHGAYSLSSIIFSTRYILSIALIVIGMILLWRNKFNYR